MGERELALALVRERYLSELGFELARLGRMTCPLCDHEWRHHDPEDGGCDSHSNEHGLCPCGRDLGWMRAAIVDQSQRAINA